MNETIWNADPSNVSDGSVWLPFLTPNTEHPMPTTIRLPWALALAAAIATTAPVTPLAAQFGGLAKKAKAALGVDKQAPDAAANVTSSTGPVSVREEHRIDAASLDLFERALAAEHRWLTERAQIRKGLRTPADYRTCSQTVVAVSPEGKKVMQMYLDAIESPANDGSVEFMTALANKMKAEQERIIFAACGYDPAEYGAAHDPSASHQPSEHAAASEVGLPYARYALLKERIVPFCALDAANRGTGAAKVPGDGRNIYYIYEPAETELLAPRCDALQRAIQAVS